MATSSLTLIPTPDTIAQTLENIHDLIGEDDFDLKVAQRMLKASARNMRVLFEMEFDPATGLPIIRNAGQMWYLVDIIIRSGVVPRGYEISRTDNNPDPAKVFLGCLKSLEIGVHPITGIANIMIVNNRASVWGDLAQALVERSGKLEWQTKEELGGEMPGSDVELKNWPDAYGWKVTTKRIGHEEPYVGVYTVAHARRSKLWMNPSKQPWITDPDRMLFNRSRSRSIRDGFADGLYGMAIAEEQDDIIVQPKLPDERPLENSALADEPEAAPTPAMPQLADAAERPEPTLDQPLGERQPEPEPVRREGDGGEKLL